MQAPGSETSLKIYPNPAKERAVIEYTLTGKQFIHMTVMDVVGRHVITLANHVSTQGTFEIELLTQNFEPGTYFIRLQAADGVRVRKIVVQR